MSYEAKLRIFYIERLLGSSKLGYLQYEISVCTSHSAQTRFHYGDQVDNVVAANIAVYYENICTTELALNLIMVDTKNEKCSH